ncbi:MAG: lipid A-modifier LpxR family protein, partial [Pseudomonadota bacterium]
SGYFEPKDGFGWYLFAGVDGRAIAQNIFLDGNTGRDSLSVDKAVFVADLQAGAAVSVGRVRIAYTYVFRTREYRGQPAPDRFGSVGISALF